MTWFSEARKRPVVATSTAGTVGRVERFVVLAEPARVGALGLAKVDGSGWLVPWSDLTAFGPDAVTVPAPEVIREPRDDAEARVADKDLDLVGKLALSESGAGLGTVKDADFDPQTGNLITVMTDNQEIAGDRLIGLGSYAAVFRRQF